MKYVRTEGCYVGLFREFVGTDCRTYGQSNTSNVRTTKYRLKRKKSREEIFYQVKVSFI